MTEQSSTLAKCRIYIHLNTEARAWGRVANRGAKVVNFAGTDKVQSEAPRKKTGKPSEVDDRAKVQKKNGKLTNNKKPKVRNRETKPASGGKTKTNNGKAEVAVAKSDPERRVEQIVFGTKKFERFMEKPLEQLELSDIPGIGKNAKNFVEKGVSSIAHIRDLFRENRFESWRELACYLSAEFAIRRNFACECAIALWKRFERESEKIN